MIIETKVNNNVMDFFLPVRIRENLELNIQGVKSFFISGDIISVTKEDSANWEELKPQILADITDFIECININEKIIGLIEARIKPAIQKDGGDIEFKGFEEGVVYVELKGNCVGCAYAMVTLKDGVEKLLKTYIPEVKEVRSIDKEA